MRKTISIFILVVAMFSSFVGCVSAVEAEIITETETTTEAKQIYRPIDSDGMYTVEYENDKIVNGEKYGFVVVEGLEEKVLDLSDENFSKVLYVGQAVGGDKTITFDNFGLKGKLPTEVGFIGGTAFIGGKGFDTATTIGTLQAPFIPVTGIELDQTDVTIEAGKTVTLAATVKPENATDKTVTWKSSDATVASVDSNGVVKGEKESATPVTITAKAGDKEVTCTVTVIAAPGHVTYPEITFTNGKDEVDKVVNGTMTLNVNLNGDADKDMVIFAIYSKNGDYTVLEYSQNATIADGKATATINNIKLDDSKTYYAKAFVWNGSTYYGILKTLGE